MSNHSLIIRLLREVILHFLFRNRLSGGKVESVNNILEEYNFFVFTLFQVGPRPEIVTRLLNKRNNTFVKSRVAAKESCKANCRAKAAFQNSINNTLRNPLLSAKKKFSL